MSGVRPMIAFFKRLLRDRRGNMIVMAAAGLPVVIGAAGLATDTIQWTLWKRQLQRAADSAAMAGVYSGMQTYNKATVEAAVDADLALNNHTIVDLLKPREVELTGDDATTGAEDVVEVTLEIQKPLTFSS